MKNANVTFNESFKEIQFEFDNATVALYFDNDEQLWSRFHLVLIENGHVVVGLMCYDYGNIVKILSLIEKRGWDYAMIRQIVDDDWEANEKAR